MYKFLDQMVADSMTREVTTVSGGVTVEQLGRFFEQDDFNAYPVVENSTVTGLVSKFDFLACFIFTPSHAIPPYEDLMKKTVADIMTPDFIYVRPDTKLPRVLQLMVDHRIRSVPVIEADRRLAGMISREDVMKALRSCACSP